MTNVDVITMAVASLAAARSADDLEVKTMYAAHARGALDALDARLRDLRLNLTTLEAELVRRSPKRMVGAQRA